MGFKQEGGKVFIETKNLKIAKYFLDFYVAYKKPTLLMAVRQNGVTALLKHKIRDLLGMHVFNPLPVLPHLQLHAAVPEPRTHLYTAYKVLTHPAQHFC